MRRAQAEMLEWLPRIILMTVAVAVIALLVTYYTNRDVDTAQVHRAAYLYRIHYSNAIMYADEETKRVYPGIVDLSKFNSQHLDEALGKDPAIASCMFLATKGREIAPACHVKETYDFYLPFAQNNVEGKGSATMQQEVFPVTIRDGSMDTAGTLTIIIVRPNT